MPCYECSNGKWKYGKKGRCQFDSLKKCKEAAAAIHAQEDKRLAFLEKIGAKIRDYNDYEIN